VREYDRANRAVGEALGVELVELPDWNCCGGVSAASLSRAGLQALGRRNLEQVPEELRQLLCPCPHCLTGFARTLAELREAGGTGADVHVLSMLDVFASEEVLSALVAKRVEPLSGLKMAAYYGCKLSRPDPEVAASGLDEPGDDGRGPLERVIEACGATAVQWTQGGECCGATLGLSRVDVADELLGRVFTEAREVQADAIVAVCPLCHLNLDLRQHQVSQKLQCKVDMPVFFVTELMAVALGMDEESERWLQRHVTSAFPMFMEFIEAQEEREYWGEQGPPGEDEEAGSRPDDLQGGEPQSTEPADVSGETSGV